MSFRRDCGICGNAMSEAFRMDALPMTELYEPCAGEFVTGRGAADQALLFCDQCSHGRLENIISPKILYGNGYRTKTKSSEGAANAVSNFARFIKQHCAMSAFDCVIDIGANDSSLLDKFDGVTRVGIDPNATGDGAIREFIEDADLSPFTGTRKAYISSHTIEHLAEPHIMLDKVSATMGDGDILALQFPSLDLLLRDARIDQVHHQHVNYFSMRSIIEYLSMHGLGVTHFEYDTSHWGALMLIAVKQRSQHTLTPIPITAERISAAYQRFLSGMSAVPVPSGSVAFGASLMLPVLHYWRPLDGVEFIADDDKGKDGMRYVNLNKPIFADYDLTGRDVIITAIGSNAACRKLTEIARTSGARRVIVPLNYL